MGAVARDTDREGTTNPAELHAPGRVEAGGGDQLDAVEVGAAAACRETGTWKVHHGKGGDECSPDHGGKTAGSFHSQQALDAADAERPPSPASMTVTINGPTLPSNGRVHTPDAHEFVTTLVRE